jgi:hypothetical protein
MINPGAYSLACLTGVCEGVINSGIAFSPSHVPQTHLEENMSRSMLGFAVSITVAVCSSVALAATAPADFNGRWKGKTQRPDGTGIELVYNLKTDQDKLTGTIEGPRGKMTIDDGKVSGDGFTFSVKFADNPVPHEAKWADGKIEITVRGPNGERKYTLTRAADVAGRWNGKFTSPDGSNNVELTFTFKMDGEKITGTVEGPQGPIELKDCKLVDDEFAFDTPLGDMTIKHKGKVTGDEMKLKVTGFGDSENDLTLKRDKAAKTQEAAKPSSAEGAAKDEKSK